LSDGITEELLELWFALEITIMPKSSRKSRNTKPLVLQALRQYVQNGADIWSFPPSEWERLAVAAVSQLPLWIAVAAEQPVSVKSTATCEARSVDGTQKMYFSPARTPAVA
jgi:hypothetical protein